MESKNAVSIQWETHRIFIDFHKNEHAQQKIKAISQNKGTIYTKIEMQNDEKVEKL